MCMVFPTLESPSVQILTHPPPTLTRGLPPLFKKERKEGELDSLTARTPSPQRIPCDFAVKCIKIPISLRFYPESPIFAALFAPGAVQP